MEQIVFVPHFFFTIFSPAEPPLMPFYALFSLCNGFRSCLILHLPAAMIAATLKLTSFVSHFVYYYIPSGKAFFSMRHVWVLNWYSVQTHFICRMAILKKRIIKRNYYTFCHSCQARKGREGHPTFFETLIRQRFLDYMFVCLFYPILSYLLHMWTSETDFCHFQGFARVSRLSICRGINTNKTLLLYVLSTDR